MLQWGRTNEASSKKTKYVEVVAQKLDAETLHDNSTGVQRVGEDSRGRNKTEYVACPYKQHKGGQVSRTVWYLLLLWERRKIQWTKIL